MNSLIQLKFSMDCFNRNFDGVKYVKFGQILTRTDSIKLGQISRGNRFGEGGPTCTNSVETLTRSTLRKFDQD